LPDSCLAKRGITQLKATGIVRRIDDLGRIVIPKEIRRTLRIREGDPLEIFVDRDGEIIFKKYSPFVSLKDFAKEYTDSLFKALGHVSCISERNTIVAITGSSRANFSYEVIEAAVEQAMTERRILKLDKPEQLYLGSSSLDEEYQFTAKVIAPIISAGDAIGAVILSAQEPGKCMGEIEVMLAKTAAEFLGKQVA